MTKTASEQSIIDALELAAPDHGVDIVDVEVVGATKAPTVRIRIDNAGEDAQTIGLDEVAAQTEWISAVIDELDPFPAAFTMEVSSPGLSRPLRKATDFERFAGETVSLSTTAVEGRRKFTGELLGIEEGKVAIECDGERIEFALDEIKKCNIKPDFSAKK